MLRNPFESLLNRQPSAEHRERLHRARRDLGLRENDALWGLIEVVQAYCDSLEPKPIAELKSDSETAARGDSTASISWMLVCIAMGIQTLLMAVAYFAGATEGLRKDRAADDWLSGIASVPAGWMLFVFALPFLLHGVRAGWRVRKRDRAAAWTLIVAYATATASLAATLWWLVRP